MVKLVLCKLRSAIAFLLLVNFILLAHESLATAQTGSGGAFEGPDPRKSYDYGLHTGPFLPYKIAGVTEVVAGWGPRVSIPTSKGVIEFSTYFGRSDGVQYNIGAVDYRLDIVNDYLPVHAIIGAHADLYTPAHKAQNYAGGWQYGGGVTQRLTGPLYFRFDFQERLGPGQSAYIALGLFMRIPEGGGS